jgi:hypothetical protein
MRAVCCLLALLSLAFTSAACGGPVVDLKVALEIQNVSTGWFDAGIVNGKNKLVPTMSFTLKNNSDQLLHVLQINAVFRRVTEKEEWGTDFLTAAGRQGLSPGATTSVLTIRSHLGYTGTDSRQQMLQHPLFQDAKVEVFAKYGSTQWTQLGEYPITRQLLTP